MQALLQNPYPIFSPYKINMYFDFYGRFSNALSHDFLMDEFLN